jgi:hypothetical protein
VADTCSPISLTLSFHRSLWKVRPHVPRLTFLLRLDRPKADLHQIIKSGQMLTNEHVQYFTYQILRGTNTYWTDLLAMILPLIVRRHEVCALSFRGTPGPQARKSARQLRL